MLFNGMENRSADWMEAITKVTLEMLNREVQKTWHKAGAIFDFIYSLVSDKNPKKIAFLAKQGFLGTILKLISNYKSEL